MLREVEVVVEIRGEDFGKTQGSEEDVRSIKPWDEDMLAQFTSIVEVPRIKPQHTSILQVTDTPEHMPATK